MLKGKFNDGSQIQVRQKGKSLEFVEVGRGTNGQSETKKPVSSPPDEEEQQPESVEN
jgi:hypothetical protein